MKAKDPVERKKQIKEEYGDRAQQVEPYAPNRHQRRLQEKAKRSKK